jgi:hypothetical protein
LQPPLSYEMVWWGYLSLFPDPFGSRFRYQRVLRSEFIQFLKPPVD